jgi:hypothetical protein
VGSRVETLFTSRLLRTVDSHYSAHLGTVFVLHLSHIINSYTMAPHSLNLTSARFHQKRSDYCETTYDSSCNTHRTVLLIIVIFVGAFVGVILSLVYVRSRSRSHNQQRALRMPGGPGSGLRVLRSEDGVATVRLPSGRVIGGKGEGWDERRVSDAPPPYLPRVPEAARVGH